MSSAPPVVLAFAASDPTCGAGLQADILTIAASGCVPACVLTAVTAQDTGGVHGVLPIAGEWVQRQARHLIEDMRVAAFKLGVLGSAENAELIGRLLRAHPEVPVVLDPVLASGRGDPLASETAMQALAAHIVPHATIATPNTLEAQRLGGIERLLGLGCRYVLVTGTHAPDAEVVNRLYDRSGLVREDRWRRLPGDYHGSGCTLASAVAAQLALGHAVPQAVRAAQAFTWEALARAYAPGRAQAIPNRSLAAQ